LAALKEENFRQLHVLEFTVDASETLVHLVVAHTSKLAEANAVEFGALDEDTTSQSAGSPIIDLRRYLEAQRQTFDKSA
jgi:hypothetical protein